MALDVLKFFWNSGYRNIAIEQQAAINALRTALETKPRFEPCPFIDCDCDGNHPTDHSGRVKKEDSQSGSIKPASKPVAWMKNFGAVTEFSLVECMGYEPLYRRKEE